MFIDIVEVNNIPDFLVLLRNAGKIFQTVHREFGFDHLHRGGVESKCLGVVGAMHRVAFVYQIAVEFVPRLDELFNLVNCFVLSRSVTQANSVHIFECFESFDIC